MIDDQGFGTTNVTNLTDFGLGCVFFLTTEDTEVRRPDFLLDFTPPYSIPRIKLGVTALGFLSLYSLSIYLPEASFGLSSRYQASIAIS